MKNKRKNGLGDVKEYWSKQIDKTDHQDITDLKFTKIEDRYPTSCHYHEEKK